MGYVWRPEDILRRRKPAPPPYVIDGLNDLSPPLREAARDIIELHFNEFKERKKPIKDL